MHTLRSKMGVEHLPSGTHTKHLFLLQLNVVAIQQSHSEAVDQLITCKGGPHSKDLAFTTLATRGSPGDFDVQIN